MELYPQSQDFLDGWRTAKKQKCVEQYVYFFMEWYKHSGDSKYAKNNALRLAGNKNDTNIHNMEII